MLAQASAVRPLDRALAEQASSLLREVSSLLLEDLLWEALLLALEVLQISNLLRVSEARFPLRQASEVACPLLPKVSAALSHPHQDSEVTCHPHQASGALSHPHHQALEALCLRVALLALPLECCHLPRISLAEFLPKATQLDQEELSQAVSLAAEESEEPSSEEELLPSAAADSGLGHLWEVM